MKYPDADSEFNKEGDEFVDVDVIEVGVYFDLFVLAEVVVTGGEATIEEVLV